jgi:hypothetical protein
MRALGTSLAMGILALTVGCGDSSSSGKDGGTGGAGGTIGTGTGGTGGTGTGGTGGAGASGSCNFPSCLTALFTAECQPSGTCITQSDATGYTGNTCYSNGVKVIGTIDMASLSLIMTYKNSKGVCYSMQVSEDATTGGGVFTFKNSSGTVVGSGTSDGTTTTITCTGGQPVTLDSTCDTSSFDPTAASDTCTKGTCTP